MRITVLLVLLVVVPAPVRAAMDIAPSPVRLSYTLTHVPGAEAPRLIVEVACRGGAAGTTTLQLPSSWGGQEHLYECVRDLTVRNATVSAGSSPDLRTLTHKPNADLVVRYELVQDVPGAPAAGRQTSYRPYLQPSFVHFIGHAGLVAPQLPDETRVAATIAWRSLPKDWVVATSFGASCATERYDGELGALLHSIFVAGDFRLQTVDVHGRKVVVAMRGAWKFGDAEFVDMAGRVFGVEREFWNDYDYPYYLVTLIPLEGDPGDTSIGGTGLTNSFATFVTTNVELDNLKWLLAHELFHNWNPVALGKLREPEGRMYWFSEGFTDYYAYELLRRSGLASEAQHVGHYNELLRSYYLSPVRDASNERIEKEFFANDDVGRIPYWRGALVAMRWDATIRAHTGNKRSLDDLMTRLRARYRADRGFVLSNETISAEARELLGADPLPDLNRYVVNGEMIVPPADGLGAPYDVATVQIARFELGADLETIVQKKMIAGVAENTAAYAAGLRNGQTIVRRKPIYVGDPAHEVEFTVKDQDGERTITYMPRSQTAVDVPQFRARSAAAAAH